MLYFKTYEQAKSDEWVVLIHGAGGSSSIWFRQISEYVRHFKVLIVDLRGHGRSAQSFPEAIRKPYTFNRVSKDVLDVLDHAKIKKAHFVGISLGTIIIRTIGEMAPERIKSMTLGGAITRLNVRSRALVFCAKVLRKHVPFIWLYKVCAYVLMPRERHKQSRNLFIREAKRLAQAEFLRWFKLTAEINPLLRYFKEKEIKVPTLYVMGEEDYMFLPAAKKIVADHDYAALRVIEGAGHVCNVDKPEDFNKYSVGFINKIVLTKQKAQLDFMRTYGLG